ncbi:XRE family transcriptional regulator [Bradyrhizobium jicamae]|uniref:XRE family transcriptional regulator n=1 Tax=Bradyrhizobium jicamae TaxID=280332 RepID=UPI0020136EE0|nr:XRE family transcriptional regulator [Bradyrhizobium jicamae]
MTKGFSKERTARVAMRVSALKSEMALHELRQARERSQEDLARELKVGQPAVAKLERRADMYVSNLRRYIEALGGSLEITARFPEGAVNITNFAELADTQGSRDRS